MVQYGPWRVWTLRARARVGPAGPAPAPRQFALAIDSDDQAGARMLEP